MNIFVDESGTFPKTATPNSWCVVSAYVSPETDRKRLDSLVLALRNSVRPYKQEIKIGDLSESQYLDFLFSLNELNGIIFASATDMSLNSIEAMTHHRDMQADKIIEHREKAIHQSMRDSLTELSDAVRKLPINLYAQLVFQIKLFHEVATRASLYYVQRFPQTLSEFRWRVDRKDLIVTEYERIFRKMLPPILQSMSIDAPFIVLEGADYSYMKQYEYAPGEQPTYLTDVYGVPKVDGFNLGKMVGDNFRFVDSKLFVGVQVADLIASGLRRLLKGEFSNNELAAKLLGQLTVQAAKNKLPLSLLSLGAGESVPPELSKRLKLLHQNVRPMLTTRE